MELKQGTLLQGGKYKIEATLGQGTFGITYLGTARLTFNGGLGAREIVTKVAIKEFFMREMNVRDRDGKTVEGSSSSVFTNYRHRFRREAENLAKLDHPNIIRVYDVFDENGTTYYSMAYVEGTTLDEYIRLHHPLPEADAVAIFGRVCSALSSMHEQRMLHLDLKPKNIMRSTQGEVFLIDFGLSKQFGTNGEPESSTTIGAGTPGYAPIEQANPIKDGTFPATLDIYALGATMYKTLTGQRPPVATDVLNEGFPLEPLVQHHRSPSLIKAIARCMSP
ncbi:MAG: serine/threonine-protein kinase, partial [Alloprevotella sp.]|nr:serine/threonine-protein kinase [Alloprevotella sp.]